MNWDKIQEALQWGWDNRTELMAIGTGGVGFATVAAGIVMDLLNKTPDGDPSQVTDQMLEDLKTNFPGRFKTSAESGFLPKPPSA